MDILQEISLKNRHMTSDNFLNAIDTIEDIKTAGGYVNSEAYAELYHATDANSAKNIVKSQKMSGKENGIFFSTSPSGQIKGYGDTVIKVYVPVEKLILDDQFTNELHYKIAAQPHEMIKVIAHQYKEGYFA